MTDCQHALSMMVRLDTSSEAEGIRMDARCPTCGKVFAVQKSGLVPLDDTGVNDMGRPHRHYENRILRNYFGTERQLQETQSDGGGVDGKTDRFAIELFQRDIPAYVLEEMEQAEGDTDDGSLLPIIVWHPKYGDHDNDLVCMRMTTFQEIINGND